MIEFGPFRLDAARRVVWKADALLPVPPKAAEILAALAARAGEVVTKQELLALVWPGTFVEEANLSVNVSTLRRVLGCQDDGQPYIQTLHRRGYRFLGRPRLEPASGPSVLAVLPFATLGAEDEPVLGVGMADALITRLARTGRLVVRPTSAILRYAGPRDPVQAGRELAADAVLDGTLLRHADRLRCSVQLLPIAAQLRPWAEAFDAAYHDLFAVQNTLAERVAAALELELNSVERARLRAQPTTDLAAYEAYARGRHLWGQFTPASLPKALTAFEAAAARDPAYAAPHAGLADLYIVTAFSGLLPPSEAWRLAGEAADRALACDADSPEAHVAKAYVLLLGAWDFAGAEQELLRARDGAPHSAATLQWLGLFQAVLGRLDDSAASLRQARALDPASVVIESLEAFLALLRGDRPSELAAAQRAADLEPRRFLGHWSLGLALLRAGRAAEAVAAHQRALELAEGAPLVRAVLARTLALAGRRPEARRLLAELRRLPHASAYQCATVHLALGEAAPALVCLETAVAAREPWVVWLVVDPMFAAIRRNRRFRALVERVFGAATAAPRRGSRRSAAAAPRRGFS